jgi:hypothetical protein
MSDRLNLHIAGLTFRLTAPAGVTLVDEAPLYRSFAGGPCPGIPQEVIEGDLTIAEPAVDSEWSVAFDSGESWIAFSDGNDLVLTFRSPTDPERYWWLVRLRDGASPLELIFSPDLVDRATSGDRIVDPLHYPLDQLLTMWLLATRGGCILHAAGAGRAGRAVAFVGRSGAGKTTFMEQLAAQPGLERLSDDRVIVGLFPEPRLCGTPWAGEGLVAANKSLELSALVFLHHGSNHILQPIDPAAAAHQLLPTTSIPFFDDERSAACIGTLDRLVQTVPAYDLQFRPEPGVFKVINHLLLLD